MIKKVFMILLGAALVLSMTGAVMADNVELNGDKQLDYAAISFESSVEEEYTVTIPSVITAYAYNSDLATIPLVEISATVTTLEGSTQKLNVGVNGHITLKNLGEDEGLTYKIISAATSEGERKETVMTGLDADPVLWLFGDGTETGGITMGNTGKAYIAGMLDDGQTPNYAGWYSGNLTFTIRLSSEY